MGVKTVIPVSFTDTTLPILRDDPILFNGSLVLIDTAHSGRVFPSIPAIGSTAVVPNLAWAEAAATIGGSPTQASLDFQLSVNSEFTADRGKIERSTKGGLHGIVTQDKTKFTVGNQVRGTSIAAPTGNPLKTHLRTYRTTHTFFISVWGRGTRVGGLLDTSNGYQQVAPWFMNVSHKTSQTANRFWASYTSGEAIGTSVGSRGHSAGNGSGNAMYIGTNGLGVPGPFMKNFGVSSYLFGSSDMATDTDLSLNAANWGASTDALLGSYGSTFTAFPSWVFYRFYMEDLTVSGRSYATVDALDNKMYTEQVLTSGGRYFGDTTPTAPSSIP